MSVISSILRKWRSKSQSRLGVKKRVFPTTISNNCDMLAEPENGSKTLPGIETDSENGHMHRVELIDRCKEKTEYCSGKFEIQEYTIFYGQTSLSVNCFDFFLSYIRRTYKTQRYLRNTVSSYRYRIKLIKQKTLYFNGTIERDSAVSGY